MAFVNLPQPDQGGPVMFAKLGSAAALSPGYYLSLVQGNHVLFGLSCSGNTNAILVTSTTPLENNGKYLLIIKYNGSSDAGGINLRLNGQPLAFNIAANALIGSTRNTSNLSFGGFAGGAGRDCYFDDFEKCWYKRDLTSSETTTIENYLRNKWNLY